MAHYTYLEMRVHPRDALCLGSLDGGHMGELGRRYRWWPRHREATGHLGAMLVVWRVVLWGQRRWTRGRRLLLVSEAANEALLHRRDILDGGRIVGKVGSGLAVEFVLLKTDE